MSSNGKLRTPSSTPSASSWVSGQLKKLIPWKTKNACSNDTQEYEDLRDLSLNLGGDVAKHHSFNRPSTDDAKNESNAANRVRRQRLNEGHKNVTHRKESNEV